MLHLESCSPFWGSPLPPRLTRVPCGGGTSAEDELEDEDHDGNEGGGVYRDAT